MWNTITSHPPSTSNLNIHTYRNAISLLSVSNQILKVYAVNTNSWDCYAKHKHEYRSTRRAATWRPIRGPTLGRSRTAVVGRVVTGSLLDLTNWRDITGNTQEWNLSSVISVIELLPGVTISVFTWKDTDNTVCSFASYKCYFLDVIWSFKSCVAVCISLQLWYGLIYCVKCHPACY